MPAYSVITDYPIAFDSPDHLHPEGTAKDNSRHPGFNANLLALMKHFGQPVSVLDLGCSGGGFVKDFVDMGHEAIGIEGSDYSLKAHRAEWATIPDRLFTADISRPFQVLRDGEPATFSVVTCWEVMEHLPEIRLPTLCENVKRHMAVSAIWIMSVSPREAPPHHLTIHTQFWWEDFFKAQGFIRLDRFIEYFGAGGTGTWVRGADDANAPYSFHFVLTK